MWFWKPAAAFLVMACRATAQDLAPEVLLLVRIKYHIRKELSHVTNYTCLETTARFHKEPGRQAKMEPLDMVRLEVAYTNHHEWYGSRGDRSFSKDGPAAFIGSGMIGDGFFAITSEQYLRGRGCDSCLSWARKSWVAGRHTGMIFACLAGSAD